MVDCHSVRAAAPDLLAETLSPPQREEAYLHIEACDACNEEWRQTREVWATLVELPELPVPPRVKTAFLSAIGQGDEKKNANVVPFRARRAPRWLAQAAAVAVIVSGSFFAGQRMSAPEQTFVTPAAVTAKREVPFSFAESQVIPAASVDPNIEGRPRIENVRFVNNASGTGEVAISFDMTSHVTVTGTPNERGMVNLLTYVLQSQDHPTLAKSNAMEWVKATYARGDADPAIVKAVANVLKNETHEGVRIKAVETLREMPPASAPEARMALIEALKNDPNPAVRMKAIEGLANLARSGDAFDEATVKMLREKASQDDENLYVRVKAAEALSQINL